MAASIFQAFRIIFGLIIAVFVLYFFLTYAGVYGETEEARIQNSIAKNFVATINNVYQSGTQFSFTQFGESPLDFDIFLDTEYNPPIHWPGISLGTTAGKVTLTVPTLLIPGDDVVVYRDSVNLGWWEFYFVEALGNTAVIFVPLDDSDDAIGLIRKIVDSMPSTEYVQGEAPKVTFGLCGGGTLYYDDLCGGRCEKDGFNELLNNGIGSVSQLFSACTAGLPANSRLVTVSGSCNSEDYSSGVCIEMPGSSGTAEAHIKGSGETYLCKNVLDLLALITGGDEQTVHGFRGSNYYTYVNDMFREQVLIAAQMMSGRAELLAGTSPEYSTFKDIMDSIADVLSEPDYYETHSSVDNLLGLFEQADDVFYSLLSQGLEYKEYAKCPAEIGL